FNFAEDVSVAADGTAWTATRANAAALRYDGEWRIYADSTTGGGFQDRFLYAVYASVSGPVWFGHCCHPTCRVDRLSEVDGIETWTAFPLINAWDITEDASGVIWFSTDDFGIYAYDASDESLINLTASAGKLSSNRVETIAPLSSRVRWIGHSLAGADRWDDAGTAEETDDTWRRFSVGDGLMSQSITAVVASGDTVYLGTPVGVCVFRDTVWLRNYTASDLGLASAQVTDLAVDALGNVWVATLSGAARMRAGGGVTSFVRERTGLVDDRVRAVAVDNASGRVWFGTEGGVSVLKAWDPFAGRTLSDAYVFPNPFRRAEGHTEVRVAGIPSAVSVSIHDLAGRQVRAAGTVGSGDRIWDGRDPRGVPVPAGIYLVKMETENDSRVVKLAVIR
ncbi:MAG: T9SS type A sorting domain-containing protein, partial [Candidatus Eisenbacteria bacterium]